jgi:hypothetical protein
MWRRQADRQEMVRLKPGTWMPIPAGTHFQFRSTSGGPLTALAVMMPPWPGKDEAYQVHGPQIPRPAAAGPAGGDVARQIDLICVPQLMSADGPLPAHNGGTAR